MASQAPAIKLIGRDFTPRKLAKCRPLVMGIDPGISGALAIIDLDSAKIVDLIDLPTYKRDSKSRKQGYLEFLDVHALSSLIDAYSPLTALAVLEEPGSMPNQGLQSTFTFGRTCGQIHGVLAGHYIPVATVKPGVWKSAMALTSNKDDSRNLASIEFPEFKSLWPLKKHNDRAEAVLLALYGSRYMAKLIELSRK